MDIFKLLIEGKKTLSIIESEQQQHNILDTIKKGGAEQLSKVKNKDVAEAIGGAANNKKKMEGIIPGDNWFEVIYSGNKTRYIRHSSLENLRLYYKQMQSLYNQEQPEYIKEYSS